MHIYELKRGLPSSWLFISNILFRKIRIEFSYKMDFHTNSFLRKKIKVLRYKILKNKFFITS